MNSPQVTSQVTHSNTSWNFSLAGKTAIITGAGRGIGAAIALRLARNGADIVVNDLSKEAAEETSKEIAALGRKSWVSTHDISDYNSAKLLVEEARKNFGRVDILVNNAGITRDSLLHKQTEAQWDEVIRVNLKGTFNMGQACAIVMMEQKSGRIVNISSVANRGNIGQSNYSASKAGVLGLTSTWALELARYGITVNAVAPGFIETPMTQKIPPEIREKFAQRIPMKRMGKPDEIANAVTFFVSEPAAYITGQCLTVDGGLSTGISF